MIVLYHDGWNTGARPPCGKPALGVLKSVDLRDRNLPAEAVRRLRWEGPMIVFENDPPPKAAPGKPSPILCGSCGAPVHPSFLRAR